MKNSNIQGPFLNTPALGDTTLPYKLPPESDRLSTFIDPKCVVSSNGFKHSAGLVEQDPAGKSLNSPGAKADANKIRPWLLFSDFANALEEVAKVSTLGAAKYTDSGWVSVDNGSNRYMDAASRHLLKVAKGETLDSGLGGLNTYHKAQVAWNILASLELDLRNAS